ncbi:MAG: acetyl/propionyl-CoA carboxylase alpha subunit [Candidatus Azotimanducaceae bacterium]|jgi:acetyl/propionyl-CoA carboxylase alpha subunit
MKKLLIANRGEIAIRVARAAAELGIETVAVYPQDDGGSLHVKKTDSQVLLPGTGVAAYLDAQAIIDAATANDCDAIHPGYGFLSENVDFAKSCEQSNLTFVGPTPMQLSLFGDKSSARQLAVNCQVPIVPGTNENTTLSAAIDFYVSLQKSTNSDHPSMLIKAIAGGGGRGMRQVHDLDSVKPEFERCQSEAKSAFGNDGLYVEALIDRAKHIEIQVVGDGTNVTHLWDRECSVQRSHQKIVEIAPSPTLAPALRQKLIDAALSMAQRSDLKSLATFEFLVDINSPGSFYFIEANPRLQVEHTVTEEVTATDLVQVQLKIAMGQSITQAGLLKAPDLPRGYAIQCRVNMETLTNDGTFKPTGGTISVFEPPAGSGIRIDGFGYSGYATSPRYDSLLAKLIIHTSTDNFKVATKKAYRACSEFRVEGLATNLPFLLNLLSSDEFESNDIYTRYVDDHLLELAKAGNHTSRFVEPPRLGNVATNQAAVFDIPANCTDLKAPLQGTIVEINVAEGDEVYQGQQILIMDAMKMEHVISAPVSGVIKLLNIDVNEAVNEDHLILLIEKADVSVKEQVSDAVQDIDYIRPDLAEAKERLSYGYDRSRPAAVAKRHGTNHRTAEENLNDLVDPGTYIEYGSLTIAAQRRRRSVDDLMKNTARDGMITGIGSVNADYFSGQLPEVNTQCVVMSYDYMVLAGTQGLQNHRKKDRMFELAKELRLPVVLIAEGGGGRPGDTDGAGIAGLDCLAFQLYGNLSGLVPRIGITTGRCFAGNAALLGASDVIIATEDSNIGMGGPAMIEGGGLGVFTPDEVGPMDVQVPNGVVDIAVKDEAEAMQAAKKYLSYFQGTKATWECADQRLLRSAIPENRLRIYSIRDLIKSLADTDSVLELREHFGLGMITAFARIEGRPIGILANNPEFLSGAIDSDGADKAARFLQLCDAFDIPILSLCDTPGIMVGPEIEKTALVRHAARMFVTGSSITVPFFTIVLRKGYGLGAQAMAGGGFKASIFTVTWPTGEFGGMGLEGAVKLGYRKELEAIEDPVEREESYQARVAMMYNRGKAVNYATAFEIDEVIDPMDSRHWIVAGLKSSPKPIPREGKKRPFIDTW